MFNNTGDSVWILALACQFLWRWEGVFWWELRWKCRSVWGSDNNIGSSGSCKRAFFCLFRFLLIYFISILCFFKSVSLAFVEFITVKSSWCYYNWNRFLFLIPSVHNHIDLCVLILYCGMLMISPCGFLNGCLRVLYLLGCRDSSAIKNIGCSSRELRFKSCHPHSSLHLSVTPFPGDWTPSSGLHSTHVVCRYMHRQSTYTHLKKLKISINQTIRTGEKDCIFNRWCWSSWMAACRRIG